MARPAIPPRQDGSHKAQRLGRPIHWAAAALFLFVASVRLLGAGTGRLAPWLSEWLPSITHGPASTVGAAWLGAYALLGGSLVAAVAVSFHAHGLVSAAGLFLLVAGARLGASGVIILLGGLASLRRPRAPLRHATRLGMLASLVTLGVYGPIAVAGALWAAARDEPLALPGPDAARTATADWLGLAMIAASLVLLWVSLWMLDVAVSKMDHHVFRRRWAPRLARPWVSFLVGLAVTAASASITVSVGALVPLYNQRLLTRKEVVPYILGASVGTLSDTVVIAAALGSWDSIAALLALGACAAGVSLALMAVFPVLVRVLEWLMERITARPVAFWSAAIALVAVPVALLW